MTDRRQLDTLLAGLVGDIDQQTALCVELLAGMGSKSSEDVCWRVALNARHGQPVAAAVAQFAALGLLVATSAWNGGMKQDEGT